MPKAIMVVQSEPADPSREAEYERWYRDTHIPQICATPGFVGARRYKRRDGGDGPHYLAIYEIEADDIDEARRALSARTAAGEVDKSDLLCTDPPPVVALYELLE